MLHRNGFAVDVCCGISYEAICEILDSRFEGGSRRIFPSGRVPDQFDIYDLSGPAGPPWPSRYGVFIDRELFGDVGCSEFPTSIADLILEYFRPDVLVTYGGDGFTLGVAAAARAQKINTLEWHQVNNKAM